MDRLDTCGIRWQHAVAVLAAFLAPACWSPPAADRVIVPAAAETEAHAGDADDPAIWLHPTSPEQSLIIGTYKRAGLGVYDLAGRQLQFLELDGGMNNVDLAYNFPLGGRRVDLVVAANWSSRGQESEHQFLVIYRVDAAARRLQKMEGMPIPAPAGEAGVCLYRSPVSGKFYVFSVGPRGPVEQWELFEDGHGRLDGALVRTLEVGAEVEGCVADHEQGYFYLGEEKRGIWKYGAEPDAGSRRSQVDHVGRGGHLTADVEGLTLYYGPDGSGYLIASSQGSSEYVVYERSGENAYVTTFSIGAGSGVDAVAETDGIDVLGAALGPAFEQGIFVVHDGSNETGQNNFKLISWQAIAAATSPSLLPGSSWDPRRDDRQQGSLP